MTRSKRPAIVPGGSSTKYKSFVPASGQRILRESILGHVFAEGSATIVVLQAPAGHGKSTVLRQIRDECAARSVRCGWLNLDESDNDSRRHSSHLRSLLMQLSGTPDLPVEIEAVETGDATHRVQQRSDWLVDLLARDESPIALFVDEFEVLTDRAVLSFWKDFLLKLPEHVRVFIAARSSPEIGLPRLAVSDRILVLSAQELRFTRDEVQRFFVAAGELQMPAAEVDAVHRGTEGWPAAVQLFRLGLLRQQPGAARKQLDQYRPRQLADYLTECVLDGLSADIRSFLVRTSVLNRLGAQVCNVLTGRSDSQNLLLRLEKRGLFVSALDQSQTWFRYHSLFSAHLREQLLSEDPAKFRLLHRQAAEWFFEHARHEDAMHHAVAANDLSFAADILEVWSKKLVADGEMAIAERWYDCIPQAEVRRRPVLQRRMAWALIFLRRRSKLALLMEAENLAEKLDSLDDPALMPLLAMAAICADEMPEAFATITKVLAIPGELDRFTAFELAAAANLDSFRHLVLGNFSEAQARLAAAQSYNRQGQAFFSEGYTACLQGVSLMLKGRVQSAVSLLRAALAAQRQELDSPFATAPLASCTIWSLYESDDLPAAIAVFDEYRDMVLECAVPDLLAVGVLSAARAFRAVAREDDGLILLSQAETLAVQSRWPRLAALFRQERLQGSGDPRAVESSSRALPEGWLPISELLDGPSLKAIRKAINREAFDVATSAIAHLLALRPDCVYIAARLGLLKAIVLSRRGLQLASSRQFANALKLVQDSGYIRMLLDEGEPVRELLERYLTSPEPPEETPLRAFARQMLVKLGRDPGTVGTQTVVGPSAEVIDLSRFSQREREIIDCLSQRMSNREIARSTHISENTVKFHLKKIFSKLGVSRRIQAYAWLVHPGGTRASIKQPD